MSHQSIAPSIIALISPGPRLAAGSGHPSIHLVSDIDAHPVFAALHATARQRIVSTGRERVLAVGELLDLGQNVAFVLEGILGTFCQPAGVCVAAAGFGSVLGLSGVGSRPEARSVEALVACRVFVSGSDVLAEALGHQRVMELRAAHLGADQRHGR